MGQEQTRTSQLILVLDAAGTQLPIDRLDNVFAGNQVACLILSTNAARTTEDGHLPALVSMAKRHDLSVLINDDDGLAKELCADGVHISPNEEPTAERYARIRDVLGSDRIVGADAGGSRHDAMTLAEAGADYVAFGIPAGVSNVERARARQRELIAWWAEVFEPPVVALNIIDNAQSQEFAALGADFIARTLPAGFAETELKQWLTCAQQALIPSVHCD